MNYDGRKVYKLFFCRTFSVFQCLLERNMKSTVLSLKRHIKFAAEDTLLFYFHLWKKIRLDVSCASSA